MHPRRRSPADIAVRSAGVVPRAIFVLAGCATPRRVATRLLKAPNQQRYFPARQLAEAGHIVGIPVVDHVVIGDGSYVSFSEAGWL